MIFEFRILGLFLLFILVCSYFLRGEQYRSHFSLVLFSTYLLEFIYLICYILEKNDIGVLFISKLYYGMLFLTISFYTYYILSFYLGLKYKLDSSSLSVWKKRGGIYLWVVSVVDVAMMLLVGNEMLFFTIILIYAGISSLFYFFLLMFYNKLFSYEKGNVLLGFSFLYVLFIMFQIYFPNLEIMESGVVLLTFYLYIFLENIDRKEADALKLERDYANSNVLQKETFLKKLSHEIRVPIHTIDGFSQIIDDSSDINEIKEDVKDIRGASLELIELINSMIDLSILEAGELKLFIENYNVYDVFEDLAKMIPTRIKSKDVSFQFHIDKGIPEVLKGDSERISQIILNIVSNAIRFTDKGKISMDVSFVKSDSLCRLMVKIDDTGKGMSEEEIHHLFDNDSGDKGIGLRVAYYLVKLMNGKLDVSSVVDKGTSVVVTFDQEIVALKQDKKEKKEKELQIISFHGKRVLLVDDNKLNLKVAEKLLLPYDVEIVSVNGGQECLDILDKDTNFDLILMDDLMPNMSGTETLGVLRKIERVSGYYIPVVVLTANATTGMREKYLESGFDDYLAKPINRDDLDQVLKKYLKK